METKQEEGALQKAPLLPPCLLFSQALAQGLRLHPFHNVPCSRHEVSASGIKNWVKPGFFRQHPGLSCLATANRETHSQGGVLDPTNEPIPESNGILLLFLFRASHYPPYPPPHPPPQEMCQSPVAELTLAVMHQRAVGPQGSPCSGRTVRFNSVSFS